MKKKTAAIVTGLATLLTSQMIGHAQYAYKTLAFPLPGGGGAFLGIDGANVVGTFQDTSYIQHAFVYNGSNYTTLDDPLAGWQFGEREPAEGTWATGISGTNIVGYYLDDAAARHGFLYNGTSWATLDDPLAGSGQTVAAGISGGNIVGNYTDTNGYHGFLYNGTSWTTLDYPGATGTSAQGISGGNIVGNFTDTNVVSHGFLYNGSVWMALDAPASAGTYPQGISGSNIVGYYSDSAGLNHGFLYNGQSWTTLDDPLGVDGTDVRGTSGSNIVGNWHTNIVSPDVTIGVSHGFLYTGGSFRTLDDPLNSLPTITVAAGIDETNIVGYFCWGPDHATCSGCSQMPWLCFLYNGAAWTSFANPMGVQTAPTDGLNGLSAPLGTIATAVSGTNIVGSYFDGNYTAHGFVYSGGIWTTLDDPLAGESMPLYAFRGTFPKGASGSSIVGYFVDTNSATHGFLYNGGDWTTLDDPLANQGTVAYGISGSNIVGSYGSSNGTHGFLYNGSNYQTLDAPQASQSGLFSGTYAKGISGINVVGTYYDSNGIAHGFLYDGKKWTILDDPSAVSERGMGTFAGEISGSNIIGYFINGPGFAGEPLANGFLATPTPGLAITSSTNGVRLSWPYNPPATWVLQENANLRTTNWTPAPGVANDGTNNFLTITPSAQAMFFRLMLQ